MKKILLSAALIASTLLTAQDYKYEITPVVGYNIAEGNLNLDNQLLVGAEFQLNTDTFLVPEFSVLYTDTDYEDLFLNPSTEIFRFAINGVHEFDEIGMFTPLAKVGIGYETIDRHLAENTDSLFVDAGVGMKMPITDALSLKTEAVYMLKHNHDRFDSNLALLAGINYAFGSTTPRKIDGDDDNDGVLNSIDECPTTPTGDKVDAKGCTIKVDGDDDNDGVLNSVDQCPTTPAGEAVNAQGCSLDNDRDGVINAIDECPTTPYGEAVNAKGCPLDDDRDGVINAIDECPTTPYGEAVNAKGCSLDDDNDGVVNSMDECLNTPIGNIVDASGCTKMVDLHVNFENDSFVVDMASKIKVQAYANFLNARKNFTTTIVGHTSTKGRASYNQKLSEKRAEAVKQLLITDGVEANRITAMGKGESEPMYNGNTKEVHAKNRRIEASLTKN